MAEDGNAYPMQGQRGSRRASSIAMEHEVRKIVTSGKFIWIKRSLTLAVIALSSAILVFNNRFFSTTRDEAIKTTTEKTLSAAASDVSLRLAMQQFVIGQLEWLSTFDHERFSHDREAFGRVFMPIMESSTDLVTLYQGDTGTLDVLKYSKIDDSSFYVEKRNHSAQMRTRRVYVKGEDGSLTSTEKEPWTASYDVREKSWFDKGQQDGAHVIDGPSFESYVTRDLNNPTSFSLIFNIDRAAAPDDPVSDQRPAGRSVFRLKFSTERMIESLNAISVGENGKLFLVRTDGVVIAAADIADRLFVDEEGVAQFRNIRDSAASGILAEITDADLNENSEKVTAVVLSEAYPDTAVAIANLDLPYEHSLRLVVLTYRGDFANDSLVFFETCRALGICSIVLAVLRLLFSGVEARQDSKRVAAARVLGETIARKATAK